MKYELLVAVCNRTEAVFYRSDKLATTLNRLESFHNPAGRLQEHDLVADRAGAGAPRNHRGHNTYEKEHSAVGHEIDLFAAKIADYLNRACRENRCAEILIAADARLTGRLREHLGKRTLGLVRDFVIKDLAKIPNNELRSHLV